MPFTTPETTNYMIAGYAVFFGIFILFITSMAIRWSNLKRDFLTLEELDNSKKP